MMDDALICPECNARVMQQMHEERVAIATQRVKDVYNSSFSSTPFLIYAICISIIAAGGVAVLISELIAMGFLGIFSMAFSAIPVVFAALSAVAAWKLYSNKDNELLESNVKKLGLYPAFNQVIGIILTVLMALITVLWFIMTPYITSLVENAEFKASFYEQLAANGGEQVIESVDMIFEFGVGLIMWIIAIVFLVLTVYLIFYTVMYARVKHYYNMVSEVAGGADYNSKRKPPVVLLCVVGAFALLGVGDMFLGGSVFSGLTSLGEGVYLLMSGIVLSDFDRKLKKAKNDLETEKKELIDVIVATNAQAAKMNNGTY